MSVSMFAFQMSTSAEGSMAAPTIASTPTAAIGAHVLVASSSGMTGRLVPKSLTPTNDAGEGGVFFFQFEK